MTTSLFKSLIVIFIIIIVFFIGASLFTQTSFFRNFIRGFIEYIVSSSTKQEFKIGSLEGNFINGFELNDVAFKVENESFITLENIKVSYSLFQLLDSSMLFSKVIPIREINAKGLDVNLIQFEKDKWNYDYIGGQKKPSDQNNKGRQSKPFKWNVILDQFKLNQSNIIQEDRVKNKKQVLNIPFMELTLSLIGTTNEINLDLIKADLNIYPDNIEIRDLSTKISLNADSASLKNLYGKVNNAILKLDASISNFKNPAFEFEGSAIGYELENIGKLNLFIKGNGKVIDTDNVNGSFSLNIKDSIIKDKNVNVNFNNIKMSGSEIHLDQGVVNTDLGKVFIDGIINIRQILTKSGSNNFDINVTANNISTAEVHDLLKKQLPDDSNIKDKELKSVLNADLNITGSWDKIEDLKIKGLINNFEIVGKNAGDLKLNGQAELDNSSLILDINLQFSKVNLSEIVYNHNLKSDITLDLAITSKVPLKGEFLQNFTASVNGEIKPSYIYGININKGIIDFDFRNEQLEINDVNLVSDSFNFSAEGNSAPESTNNINYKLDVNDLGFLYAISKELNLEGELKARGNIKGKLNSPEIKFESKISNFKYINQKIGVESIAIKGDVLVAPEDMQVNIKGNATQISVNSKTIEELDVDIKTENKIISGQIDIKKTENNSAQIVFDSSNLFEEQKDIEISKFLISYSGKDIQNKESIYISTKPGQIDISSLNLYSENSFITADATIINGKASKINLDITNLDLSNLSETIQLNPPVTGTVNANLKLAGTVSDPVIECTVDTDSLSYREFSSDSLDVKINYLNENLDLFLNASSGGKDILYIKGQADIDLNLNNIDKSLEKSEVQLVMKSSGVDLSPIAGIMKDIDEIDGKLIIDLKASGKILNPSVNGNMALNEVNLKVSLLRNNIRIHNAQLIMNGSNGILKELDIHTGDGTGKFSGQIDLSDFSYQINGELDKLLLKPDRISANLTGNIDLEGKNEKMDITGDLKVDKARVNLPKEKQKQVADIKFVEDNERPDEFMIGETKKTDFFIDNIGMNITIDVANNSWVKGQGANVELGGELIANKKYGEDVRLFGNIDAKRGTYESFGKLFKIEEGNINFTGRPKINPLLDIKALYNVASVNIYIQITGTAEKPTINLSSDPPKTENDIVSYLLFGTSSENIGTSQRNSIQSITSGIVGGIALNELEQLLGNKLALDIVSIGGGASGPQIEVGKYVTDDLYIAYERGSVQTIYNSTDIIVDKMFVEYRIFEFLTLQSDVGGENSGADVFFNYNYK